MYLCQFIYYNSLYNDNFHFSFKYSNNIELINNLKNNIDNLAPFFNNLSDCNNGKIINLDRTKYNSHEKILLLIDEYSNNIEKLLEQFNGIYSIESDSPYACICNIITIN